MAERPEVPQFFDLLAGGSMVCDVPAHLMGDRGGAYRYGTLKVGGITNMLSNGETLRPIMVDGLSLGGPLAILLGGTPGTLAGAYDQISNTRQNSVVVQGQDSIVAAPTFVWVNSNGEFVQSVSGLSYGALLEEFTMAGVTVSVTNASASVTFSGSVAGLTLPGYAYTPNFNAPRRGDILEVTDTGGGSPKAWHRLIDGSGAAWTIFPAWAGNTNAGRPCKILRTGYGSFSREVYLPINTSYSVGLHYYVGNLIQSRQSSTQTFLGTIECVTGGAVAQSHFMAPVLSPSNAPLYAVDLIYSRGFLLYGAQRFIGWSQAGFPRSATAPFASDDFLDVNISVPLDDLFVGFELLGDQIVAICQKSMYLVQQTGAVPEFEFHRLPQKPGALTLGLANPQGVLSMIDYVRGHSASGSSLYFSSRQGIMEMRGAPPAAEISEPVNSYDHVVNVNNFVTTFDDATDSLLYTTGHARGLGYRRESWFQLDLTALGELRGLTAGIETAGAPFDKYKPYAVGYWDPDDQSVRLASSTGYAESTGTSLAAWIWATPLKDLTHLYAGFRFGGFIPVCRATIGATAPVNLTWTVYGGNAPDAITSRATGTFDYHGGADDMTERIGPTLDVRYVGIVLTGTRWIELARCRVFDAAAQVGR